MKTIETSENKESAAMNEVLAWKRRRNDEVADLAPGEAIRRMMELADERSRPMIERIKRLSSRKKPPQEVIDEGT